MKLQSRDFVLRPRVERVVGRYRNLVWVAGAAIWLAGDVMHGATIKLLDDNLPGQNGFSGADGWEGGEAPGAGNDYTTDLWYISTGPNVGDAVFAGDSLTVDSGFSLYGVTDGQSYTVADLRLTRGGSIENLTLAAGGGRFNKVLAGTITLAGMGGKLAVATGRDRANGPEFVRDLTVSASIRGGGNSLLTLANAAAVPSWGSVTLSTPARHLGGTRIEAYVTAIVDPEVTLGWNAVGSDVELAGGKLVLKGADNLGDKQRLILGSGQPEGAVSLEFSGQLALGGLSLDGGVSWVPDGTYAAADLNSLSGATTFSGTGSVAVSGESRLASPFTYEAENFQVAFGLSNPGILSAEGEILGGVNLVSESLPPVAINGVQFQPSVVGYGGSATGSFASGVGYSVHSDTVVNVAGVLYFHSVDLFNLVFHGVRSSSPTSGRPSQLHIEFNGLTPGRTYLAQAIVATSFGSTAPRYLYSGYEDAMSSSATPLVDYGSGKMPAVVRVRFVAQAETEVVTLYGSGLVYAQEPTLTAFALSVLPPEEPAGGYGEWAAAHAGGQGAAEDFDGDGVPNGVEYFFGVTGSGFTPTPGIAGDGSITWPRGAATDATFQVQVSEDLEEWTEVEEGELELGSDFVRYTLPAEGDAPVKRFVRLVVSVD